MASARTGRLRRPPAVARVLERVTSTARRHDMFVPGETVLVAVSGGPDSICLLYSLYHLRRLFRIRLQVFHFDHRLRPDSCEDVVYVERICDRLRLPFHLIVAEDRPPRGESKEAWAHMRRRIAAMYLMSDVDAAKIATAHTQDDQAETMLMAALTGAGLSRLAGIDPRTGPFIRPLIDVSRADVESFCRALHLRPRRDPTNTDPTYALRNAIRLRGLPALERATSRGVREPLARTAALLREDANELTRQMSAVWDDVFEQTEDGARLHVARLTTLTGPIASRLVSQAVFRCGVQPSAETIDGILDLAAGRPGRRRAFFALNAVRDREYVSLSRSSPESRV